MFTRFYALVAGIITLLGVFRIVMAYSLVGEAHEVITRYLGHKTTGEAIEQGIYALLIGLTMILLAKIALILEKLLDEKSKK